MSYARTSNMENENVGQHSFSYDLETTSKQKYCWLCFCTSDNDFDSSRDWVAPCKCSGSIRWVHQACVQLWVDDMLNENPSIKALCPLCYTEYTIVYTEVNYIVQLFNKFDEITNQLGPYLSVSFVCCLFYWSASYYGFITVKQVMGEQEAITMIENTNRYVLLLVLPFIPIGLILGKRINWDETLLLWVQRFTSQSLLRTIMPSFIYEPVSVSTDLIQSIPTIDQKATVCSALFLPTMATIVGRILFGNSSRSNFQKTLLGGLVYIAVKGALRIYQQQLNAIKQRTHKIVDYPDWEVEESALQSK